VFVIYLYLDSFKNNWFGVNIWDLLPLQLVKLGFLVITVFSASFGPFIAMVSLICYYLYTSRPIAYSLILDVVLSCYSHLLGIGTSKFFSDYQLSTM
jgi:hypothetical protein